MHKLRDMYEEYLYWDKGDKSVNVHHGIRVLDECRIFEHMAIMEEDSMVYQHVSHLAD